MWQHAVFLHPNHIKQRAICYARSLVFLPVTSCLLHQHSAKRSLSGVWAILNRMALFQWLQKPSVRIVGCGIRAAREHVLRCSLCTLKLRLPRTPESRWRFPISKVKIPLSGGLKLQVTPWRNLNKHPPAWAPCSGSAVYSWSIESQCWFRLSSIVIGRLD